VPAIDLVFKDRTIQQRVNRFRRHYDARWNRDAMTLSNIPYFSKQERAWQHI
jgi:hypothetical protein